MMIMMNCFCGMVDRRKAFSLISSRDHCQRSSPSRISDTPRAGFEAAQNLSSGLVEWSCAVIWSSDNHFTTTPLMITLTLLFMSDSWLGIVNLKESKHFKKNKWINSDYSVASKKMKFFKNVEFLNVSKLNKKK